MSSSSSVSISVSFSVFSMSERHIESGKMVCVFSMTFVFFFGNDSFLKTVRPSMGSVQFFPIAMIGGVRVDMLFGKNDTRRDGLLVEEVLDSDEELFVSVLHIEIDDSSQSNIRSLDSIVCWSFSILPRVSFLLKEGNMVDDGYWSTLLITGVLVHVLVLVLEIVLGVLACIMQVCKKLFSPI